MSTYKLELNKEFYTKEVIIQGIEDYKEEAKISIEESEKTFSLSIESEHKNIDGELANYLLHLTRQ